MPQISIIIPARNEEKYIKKTLDSVFASDYKDYEVTVILDSCTDNTQNVIQPYKNLNFISINARKASIARNKGAELAKGSILVFLDADTIIPQNLLSTIHAQFTPQYSVATVKAVPDQQKLIPNLMLWSKELYITLKLRISSNGIIITNKDTFQKIKFREDLPFHEDGIFMRQAAKLGKFLYIKSTTVTESMRRYQIMGYIKPTWFWIKEFWKNIFGKRAKEYPLAR